MVKITDKDNYVYVHMYLVMKDKNSFNNCYQKQHLEFRMSTQILLHILIPNQVTCFYNILSGKHKILVMKYSQRRNSFMLDMYGMKVHYYNNTHTESIPMSFGIHY